MAALPAMAVQRGMVAAASASSAAPPAPQVFISYRRDDAAGYARALAESLGRHFGAAQVFIDVDDLQAGQPFAPALQQAVAGSAVLLVLIGQRWAGQGPSGRSRLLDPDDFVRREVALGLAGPARVIPVLLDGAPLPAAQDLPAELQPLLQRQALVLDNARYADDLDRLIAAVSAEPAAPVPRGLPGAAMPPRRLAVWVLMAALLGAAAWGAWWGLHRTQVPAGPGPGPAADASLALSGRWQAEVVYPWSNARYLEQFSFSSDGAGWQGQASFLGAPRQIQQFELGPQGLHFTTHSRELGRESGGLRVHHYRGRLQGELLQLQMQTEVDGVAEPPLSLQARRLPPAAAASAAGP
jgi:TIR domain